MAISLSRQARKNVANSLRGSPKMATTYSATGQLYFAFIDNRVSIPNGSTFTMFDYLNTCMNFSGNDGAIAGANSQYVLGTYISKPTDMPTDFNVLEDATLSYFTQSTWVAHNSGTIGSVIVLRPAAYVAPQELDIYPLTIGSNIPITFASYGIGPSVPASTYNGVGTTYTVGATLGPMATILNGVKSTISGSTADSLYGSFHSCSDSVGGIGSGAVFEFDNLNITAGATYTFGGMNLKITRFV
jgi:hypothetical protein